MMNEIDIPQILYSADTGSPLERCMICDKFLLDEGTPYFIEKSVRQWPGMRPEVIFEYAVCLHCSIAISKSLSEESRKRTSEYLMKNAHLESRWEKLSRMEDATFSHWISRCLLKDTPIEEAREYQIVAQCVGRKVQLHDMPFALSLEAMDELAQLLSAESQGEMDDFLGKHFSGPPELAEILRRRSPILI